MVRTFADINDERIRARGHVDPFPGQILHLQAGVIRRLKQLSSHESPAYPSVVSQRILHDPHRWTYDIVNMRDARVSRPRD